MSRVEIAEGVFVELPDRWTLVANDLALIHAAGAITLSRSVGNMILPEVCRWQPLLLCLTRKKVTELADRLLQPGAPFRLIDFYPPGELVPDNFTFQGTRLIYNPTAAVHRDLHYRVCRPTIIKPAVDKPRTTRPGIQARRVRLVFDNEEALGWSSRYAFDRLKAARDAARDRKDAAAIADLAGLDRNDTALGELNQAVDMLRDDPKAPIGEILDRIRGRKLS